VWQSEASAHSREVAVEINRAVVIVKPRQPCVDWANSFDDGIVTATLESLHDDPTAYLVPPYEMDDEREDIIKEYYSVFFENELEGWVTDEDLWPQNRDLETFNRWFDVDFCSIVRDLSDERLEREEW
jgi:hypothetical protein